jgi:hypothetical protein
MPVKSVHMVKWREAPSGSGRGWKNDGLHIQVREGWDFVLRISTVQRGYGTLPLQISAI